MSERRPRRPAARMPHVEFVAMVALLMALNAMAIDVILPALQQMGESLAVADENTRQLPLTAYIAFFGLSQLVYGTLSDHFGRRPVLLFGLAIYVARLHRRGARRRASRCCSRCAPCRGSAPARRA